MVGSVSIALTTSIPLTTLPKTVCLPSRKVFGAVLMKNCEPLVLGPAFAIAIVPTVLCFFFVDLVGKFVARAARAPKVHFAVVFRERVAALDHKARDHAMEFGAIVKTLFRQFHEIRDGTRPIISSPISPFDVCNVMFMPRV